MVSDQEPRYRLVDPDTGDIVGTLYAQADGTLAIQEGTSGSDNEVTVGSDGTFNAPAVSADDINNTVYVRPGEDIQTALNNQDNGFPWTRVKLWPETTYDQTGISVPGWVILDLNGSRIQPSTDGDIISLDGPGAQLWGPGWVQAGVGHTHTGAIVKVDASNFSDNLKDENQNTVAVKGYPLLKNNQNDGDLLVLESAGSNQILTGNIFEIKCRRANRQVVIRTNDGAAINGVTIRAHLDANGCTVPVVHENTAGSAAGGVVHIYGVLQLSSANNYGIRNKTSQASVEYHGRIWDTGSPSNSAVAGDSIKVPHYQGPVSNVNFGTGTTVGGFAELSLSGNIGNIDATNYRVGNVISDTDNAGDVYLVYDNSVSGGVTQIGT